jgi:ubiquinone/menaquinone biosynthesis C-methylase UbiE
MREMFSTIAPKYDFITRAFSFGMDRGWKRMAVRRADMPTHARVLDLACGTGDFGKLARAQCAGAQIVAADLTEPMLRRAEIPDSACADAASLPFQSSCFDAVFIGYGLRNFPHLDVALQEVHRVLKPGGALVSLDFFLPQNTWLRRARRRVGDLAARTRPCLYLHSRFTQELHGGRNVLFNTGENAIHRGHCAQISAGRHRRALGYEIVGERQSRRHWFFAEFQLPQTCRGSA